MCSVSLSLSHRSRHLPHIGVQWVLWGNGKKGWKVAPDEPPAGLSDGHPGAHRTPPGLPSSSPALPRAQTAHRQPPQLAGAMALKGTRSLPDLHDNDRPLHERHAGRPLFSQVRPKR